MGRPAQITRDQILEVARSLFSQKGFEATTLDDIARQLGVSAAGVLRHVGSKQKLFFESMSSSHHELAGAILALDAVAGDAPPEVVLRKLAQEMIPFLKRRVDELVVLALHLRARDEATAARAALPSGPDSPPGLALAALERYFKRARKCGTITLSDPKASALLFLGAIQSYVFFQHLVQVSTPPYPPAKFIDALMELWREGAFASAPAAARGGKRGR
jgi:AcrR family transcriptional regulator